MAILGNVLQGAVTGATGTYKDRLMDQLVKQREQDMERKKLQTALYEELVRSGAYGKVDPDDVLKFMQDTWGDHKDNRAFLKEHGEKVGTLHKGIDAAMGLLGIHPQGPSFMPAPRGPDFTSPPPPPTSSALSMPPGTATNTGALDAARQQAAQEGTLNPPVPGQTTPQESAPGSLFPLSKPPGMQAQQRQVGDIVTSKGVPHRITGINNDGSYQAEPLLGGGSSMGMQ